MFDKVRRIINENNMINVGDKIVIGVSGGPDSVSLLDILVRLSKNIDIQLFVVHINHCIRGNDANKDEEYVIKLAEEYNIPYFVKRENIKEYAETNKLTLEESGRIVRYNFYKEILEKVGANKVAIGHNMNDKVETFLFNLMRGSGLEGLTSIDISTNRTFDNLNMQIIRPLINIERQEIEEYCSNNKLNFCLDKSNFENIYTRNKIRNLLIPFIKDNFNENIISTIDRTMQILKDENIYLNKIAIESLDNCLLKEDSQYSKKIVIDITKFNLLDLVIKSRVLRLIFKRIKGNSKNVTKNHIDKIIKLVDNKRTNTKIQLTDNIKVEIEYNKLIFSYNTCQCEFEKFNYKINIGENNIPILNSKLNIKIGDKKDFNLKNPNMCVLDFEKLTNNINKLVLRNRLNGDIITPIGMNGTKKIKDYFIDRKIPIKERDKIPLLVIDDEVIWIVGYTISEKFKVDNKTKGVIVCEYVR